LRLSYTAVMRVALTFVAMIAATGCGQTGSLYLPDETVETPVEIRTQPAPADDEKEKKNTQPPGG
jgi:predicted small lipoprotein YifL